MKRLFDDPSLPSELRADLLRSRQAGEDYDPVAKLSMLHSALSHASRQPGMPPTAADEPASSVSRLHLAPWTWKVAVLAVLGGGAFLAAWPSHSPARPAPDTQPPAAIMQVVETPAAMPAATSVEMSAQVPAAISVDAPAPSVAPNPRSVPRSSRREIDQLVRIRALLEHDPTAAYRLAQRSEQEFPRGVLSEERQALQVIALAKRGTTQAAERAAQQFFARYPESPMRELVQSALHH
jgi:hypothetical protein